MNSPLQVGTAFYHAGGRAPNGRTLGDEQKFRMYYLCMAVFFMTARRALPDARLTLFTNRALPAEPAAWLAAAGAETCILQQAPFVTDPAFSNAFPGCLFSLDVLDHLAGAAQPAGTLLLLDSDCIFLRRPDRIMRAIAEPCCIAALEMDYPLNYEINGHTRASLSLASRELYGATSTLPLRYFGGEFYAMKTETLPALAARIHAVWAWLKRSENRWLGSRLTEEHVVSLALGDPELTVLAANDSVKRIWTADNYSNVDGSESTRDVWHLPAEKQRGFPALHRLLLRDAGALALNDDDFLRLAQRAMALAPAPGVAALRRARGRLRGAAKAALAALR